MKRHSCSLILLVCSACLYTGCGYAGPEKAVRRELDAIQKLDENTITSFVSYEDVQSAAGQAVGSEPDATDAIKLFFKNFKYHIDSSSSPRTVLQPRLLSALPTWMQKHWQRIFVRRSTRIP